MNKNEILAELKNIRKEIWHYYHDGQNWKFKDEIISKIDNIIREIVEDEI